MVDYPRDGSGYNPGPDFPVQGRDDRLYSDEGRYPDQGMRQDEGRPSSGTFNPGVRTGPLPPPDPTPHGKLIQDVQAKVEAAWAEAVAKTRALHVELMKDVNAMWDHDRPAHEDDHAGWAGRQAAWVAANPEPVLHKPGVPGMPSPQIGGTEYLRGMSDADRKVYEARQADEAAREAEVRAASHPVDHDHDHVPDGTGEF